MPADGDVEIQVGVDLVGLRLAQVPGDAGGAQQGRRSPIRIACSAVITPISTVRCLKMRLSVSRPSRSSQELRELLAPAADASLQRLRDVLRHAAGAEVVDVVVAAARRLVEFQQVLALLEAPERRGDGAAVERVGGDIQQVVQDARARRTSCGSRARARRPRSAAAAPPPARRHAPAFIGDDIVEAIHVGHRLHVGLVLDQLLGAAMQQADMRIGTLHHLALHLEDEAQHAMRRRVLRAEIDGVAVDLDGARDRLGRDSVRLMASAPRCGCVDLLVAGAASSCLPTG